MDTSPFEAQEPEKPVRIRFRLLPWQEKARKLRARRSLVVVNSGVHTGKTVWGACELLDDMLHHPNETFWWVAGLKFQLDAMWETFAPHARMLGARIRSHPYLFARMPNGAKVYGVSAENLEVISAHHPVAIYGDEVAKWRKEAWQLVRVRLLRQGVGRGLFLSTPRPNFWRDLVRWARSGRDNRWGLVECSTLEAGLVPATEVEALRQDLPEELYQQEILARILEGAGTVFKKVRDAAIGEPEDPIEGQKYVIGYDPAKLRDFAVAVVRHKEKVVCMKRWSETSYTFQAQMVADLARRYNNAYVYIDATGPGQGVLEMLEKQHQRVKEVTFTNDLKEEMVNANVVRFEQGKIVLPSVDCGEPYATLIDELTAFERHRTSSGLHYTYSAPDGMHDDCVTALMLAYYGKEVQSCGVYIMNLNPGNWRPLEDLLWRGRR